MKNIPYKHTLRRFFSNRATLKIAVILLGICFGGFNQHPVAAQEAAPATTPDSEALTKLKEQNALLEQKVKKAENQKKLLDFYLPGTDQELPKGSITLENNPYIETEILVHQVMAESAQKFGDQILQTMKDPDNQNKLFIYSETQFASPVFYRAYLSQLDLLEKRYLSLPGMTTPTPSPGTDSVGVSPTLLLPLIEGALGSAADIASFFKSDQVIRGVSVNVDELSFISQVAKKPIDSYVKVFYPSILMPDLFNPDSAFLNRVGKLYDFRVRAASEIARLSTLKQSKDEEIEELAERIKGLPDGPEKAQLIKDKKEAEAVSKAYADRIAPYRVVNALFEELVAGLLKPGDNSGVSTLVTLLQAEKLQTALDANSYILVYRLKTGGNVKTTSNIWRGTKHYHSGGSIATFALFNSKMEMIDAGLDSRYHGYIKVKSSTEKTTNLGSGELSSTQKTNQGSSGQSSTEKTSQSSGGKN